MALPIEFITRTRALLGEEYDKLEAALQADVPVSIRINRNKGTKAPSTPQVGWSETGYYLPERLSFTFDPLFHAGAYYVQEASSMFLEQAIRNFVSEPVKCLDLCAAPGGKSTHLLNLLPEGSLLVSNEVIRTRSNILAENITKWGNPNNIVTNNDPEDIGRLTHLFDVIVTDVPCSGEGMFRKDTDSTGEWSVANVNLCAARQRRIIHDIWNALKPGGLLIYSTCTYNPGENEEILNWMLTTFDASSIAIRHNFPAITPSPAPLHGYHFYPHKTNGEGLFMGVIQKNDGTPFIMKKEKRATPSPAVKLPADILPLLPDMTPYTPYIAGETLGILPKQHAEFIQYLSTKAGVIYKGCEIGECVKGKTKPAHSLALYHKLQQKYVTRQEVDLPTALQFLRKEDIRFDAPKGEWILITYKGIGLGWVKEVGNRVNNYYPKEWRIRQF